VGNGYERRGQDFADELHERARESAFEYRKHLISFSTAALAVFFLALTTKIEPKLTQLQLYTIAGSVLFMAAATVAGLYCWHADATRNYYWAKVEEGKQTPDSPKYDTLAKTWKGRLETSTTFLRYFFGTGISFSVVYMLERVFER
jgi:hypothetical protein